MHYLRNKKTLAAAFLGVIVLVALACFFLIPWKALFSAQEETPSWEEVLEDKLSAYETDLQDSLVSLDTNEKISDYLMGWGKNKGISATCLENGTVIFSIEGDEGLEAVSPAAIAVCFDAENMDKYVKEIAIALTVANNGKNHGPFKVLFLPETHGDFSGALSLGNGILTEDTTLLCLGDASDYSVTAVTGGYRHFTITHKLHYETPSYEKAYRISIENCPSLPMDDGISDGVNPIKTLGSVLANFQSTSLLFELSSFYGGSDEAKTPESASMTVVINEADVSKFTKKMDNAIEKVYNKYQDDYPDIQYTYEEVSMPKAVISSRDTENLVSLMYTSMDGIYTRDKDGNVVALTNIGKLSNKNNRLTIEIYAVSSDSTVMEEISDTYETICGLCDVTYQCAEDIEIYNGLENPATIALLGDMEEAYLSFTGNGSMRQEATSELTLSSILHQTNPALSILYLGVTKGSQYDLTGTIATWLEPELSDEATPQS